MNGSIGAIITLGFGNGTFTPDLGLLVTLGYGIADIVTGPFCVVASQFHAPGSISSQSHAPGSVLGQHHSPGSVSGQTC